MGSGRMGPLSHALSLFLPQLPPTYEESIRQSVQSIDILSLEERPVTVCEAGTDLPAYEALPPITDSQDPVN